jgi:DNA helicase HerA-like ATPase
MKTLYEKLSLFYLGKSTQDDSLTLLKNKNLTTHAAIIGMTGSGKTGLGMGLIEEAMLDNIPAILIDPKGDMGNLCMRSPQYDAKDFIPWVGEENASQTAQMWKEGIESWDQDITRSQQLAQTPVTIYTPGSSAGVSVNILSSLAAPGSEILEDSDLFSAYLGATASSLLALIGEESDIHSKTYTLISTLIAHAWRNDQPLTLESLIGSIINPSFDKIGFLPLNDFFPSAERFKLASQFNSVLANPSFAQWLEGVELDIDALLFDENAKAKVSIFSIAHLSDSERMFFVTMLLNRYIAWMRRQSGTSTLRTLLYMDEIYGYFPPSKNPPSKAPMMLLLKQARAFGVGVILSTQNPVDLDYKGLSNIGTWFIGRLQTRQDIDKVIEGLSGKLGSGLSKEAIREQLSTMQKRTFFLKSAHRESVDIFQTRWVLSYLKGPLKRDEIKALMRAQKGAMHGITQKTQSKKTASTQTQSSYTGEFVQYYDVLGSEHTFYPLLAISAEILFHNASKGINEKEILEWEIALDETGFDLSDAQTRTLSLDRLATKAPSHIEYAELPAQLVERDADKKLRLQILTHLYQNMSLEMFRVRSPKLESYPKESLPAFKVRFQDLLNQQKDAQLQSLEKSYASKEARIVSRLQKAQARLEKEESDVSAKTTDTLVSAGLAIFGAFFGGRSGSRVSSTISKGARISKEKADVRRIESDIEALHEEHQALQDELEEKIDRLAEAFKLSHYSIETYHIRAKKRDIAIKNLALIWRN